MDCPKCKGFGNVWWTRPSKEDDPFDVYDICPKCNGDGQIQEPTDLQYLADLVKEVVLSAETDQSQAEPIL